MLEVICFRIGIKEFLEELFNIERYGIFPQVGSYRQTILLDLHGKFFYRRTALDNEVPVKFWKSSGLIRTRIRTGLALAEVCTL